MSLSADEKKFLREAIYVASQGANPTLSTALAQLNEMVLDDTYPFWTNKAVIDSAIARSPGYMAAWDSLLRELKDAPPIGGEVFTPEPEEHPSSYPTPPGVADVMEFEAAVKKVLADNGVFLEGGRVGFGGSPVQDTDARITVHGGQILGKTPGNSQNPVDHENILDICNSDGGIRFLQYGRYFNGKRIRNTLNRVMSVFAIFDSMGGTCINDDASEPGQNVYILRDAASKTVTIATYKPGWKVRIVETSEGAPYSAMDVQKL